MLRDELLKIVQENKKQHEAMRKEALAGYCEKATAACEEAVAKLLYAEPASVLIRMRPPEDHTRDYERAIRMLEKTQQTEIELSEHDFATLVDDDWEWTGSWVTSNRGFSKTVSEYATGKGL